MGPNGFAFSGTGNAGGTFPVSLGAPAIQQGGTYTLVLKSSNGCSSSPASVIVDIVPVPPTPALSVSSNQLCQGETLQLNSNAYTGNVVHYNWFYLNAGIPVLLATTSFPTYLLPSATPSNSGSYFVVANVNGCVSDPSNLQNVSVLGIGTSVTATNNTFDNDPACEGETVQLSATIVPGATYHWYGPLGFHSTMPNPALMGATTNQAGSYLVVVTLPNCSTAVTASTTVYVQAAPQAPVLTGVHAVCEGSGFTLSVAKPDPAATYDFYFGNNYQLLAADAPPVFSINNIVPAQAGTYFAVAKQSGCSSPLSQYFQLAVDIIPGNAADAGSDQVLCSNVGEATLLATPPSSGVGKWSSPSAGATIINPDQASTLVKGLKTGENIFVWTLSRGACLAYSADTVAVHVNPLPDETAFAGLDQSICSTGTISLKAESPLLATGSWSQSPAQAATGVFIDNPTSPTTAVTGLKQGASYSFTWSLSFGTCKDFSTDEVTVSLAQMPDNQAFIPKKEYYACDDQPLLIQANAPLQGMGKWSAAGNAFISEPTSPATSVDDLTWGKNLLIWSLSTAACPNYSSDTLTVWREALEAMPESFDVPFNGSLQGVDLLENDLLDNSTGWDFFLLKKPLKGELTLDAGGIVTYLPYRNAFGKDELVYKICSAPCPLVCDTALVSLFIEGGSGDPADCFVPNLVTPNADGENDTFVVPCAAEFTGSSLSIFNRWGAKIFETDNYQNDWDGSWNGSPVPVGTYFYQLVLRDGKGTVLQGYVVVMR
jgi:gliding motility-associated-like protein